MASVTHPITAAPRITRSVPLLGAAAITAAILTTHAAGVPLVEPRLRFIAMVAAGVLLHVGLCLQETLGPPSATRAAWYTTTGTTAFLATVFFDDGITGEMYTLLVVLTVSLATAGVIIRHVIRPVYVASLARSTLWQAHDRP